jgi:hypothetical protein
LFSCELFDLEYEISAVPSYQLVLSQNRQVLRGFYADRFQGGVLALTPNSEHYTDLLAKKDVLECRSDPSDQGFLNEYYKDKWNRLSPIYNATRRVYMSARKIWEEMKDDIRVIHYTLEEPWKKPVKGCEEIEKLWWDCYTV